MAIMKTIKQMARLGGMARAQSLTRERRLEIAKLASKAAQNARKKKVLDLAGKVSE